LSDLLHQAARVRSEPQTRPTADVPAGPAVPPVDTTFRSAVNEIPNSKGSRSLASRAARGLIALLLTVGIGIAAVGWKSYGEVAKKKIIKAATQLVLTPSLSSEQPADATEAASPATAADTANPAAPQAAPAAQTAAETVAPAADSAQSLQSMARDLASLGQQVEQLKAGMEQLKASQQQVTHDTAKASEQSLRTAKASVPRPVAPRVRKPQQPYYSYPQAAAAPALPPQAMAPPAPALYVPRQVEPPLQTTTAPPVDPELSSIPRPPMPMRQ
jgi:hypothetical protein